MKTPDLGPYAIECVPTLGMLLDCGVVDMRRPIGDGDGKGFERVFEGSYAECDAWIEAANG